MVETGCAPSQPQGQLLGLGLGMTVGNKGWGQRNKGQEVKDLVRDQETLVPYQCNSETQRETQKETERHRELCSGRTGQCKPFQLKNMLLETYKFWEKINLKSDRT